MLSYIQKYASSTTADYVRQLHDLEDHIADTPTWHNTIRCEKDRSLRIFVKFKENITSEIVNILAQKSKIVGEMAVMIQNFTCARIEFLDHINKPILYEVIVVGDDIV